jgi:hypothetical protein
MGDLLNHLRPGAMHVAERRLTHILLLTVHFVSAFGGYP